MTMMPPPPGSGEMGAPVRDRPVPRISIHAFCDQPETGAVIQRAAMDRRLARAHVTVHMGGMTGAIEHFSETPTPNLVMVETRDRGKDVLARLTELASVCDPTTKVIVIGAANDITLYRELIRQGVSEYLVAPLHPLQVIEAIAALYVGPETQAVGRIYAFVGAKGGTGSSTIAHNAAWCFAEKLQMSTTVVDLDLPFGTAGLDFNQDPSQGIADALGSPERLDDVLLERLLVKCGDRLNLFAAPAVLDRDYDIDAGAFESVLEVVRHSAPAIVVDVPHLWTAWTRQLLSSADEVVITASPDLASLRNAKNIVDLVVSGRPNDSPPRLVMNQVGIAKRPEIPVKDFADALSLEPSLILPFDPQLFGTAANNGQMIPELNPASRAAEGLINLCKILTGREPVAASKAKSGSLLGFLKTRKAG